VKLILTPHELRNLLCGCFCRHRHPKARLRFWIDAQSFIEGDNLVARINTEQKVKVTVAPKTAGGHDAPIDGGVTFTSDNPDIASIEVIDNLSAFVHGVAIGAALITAEFDADMGDGVRDITATGAIEVVAAEAATAEIVFADPEPA
jgi:hypothetical protein